MTKAPYTMDASCQESRTGSEPRAPFVVLPEGAALIEDCDADGCNFDVREAAGEAEEDTSGAAYPLSSSGWFQKKFASVTYLLCSAVDKNLAYLLLGSPYSEATAATSG